MSINEVFEDLRSLKGKQYTVHKNGLPPNARENLHYLCELFEESSKAVREEISSRVGIDNSYLFLIFSEVMAVGAVREMDKGRIIRGLEALAIENCTFDCRDSTVRLALLNHSAGLIGANSEHLIRSASDMALDNARNNLFAPFLERDRESTGIRKFGFKEGRNASGEFVYVSVP